MNQKGISWLLIVVLIAVVLAGGYYLGTKRTPILQDVVSKQNPVTYPNSSPKESTSSTTVDTSNWKIYMNSRVGINAKYPSDWVISQYIFISQVPFTAGNQDQTKTYNIIAFEKYATQIYEGISNQQLFDKVNNLNVGQSLTDQRVVETKLTAGKVITGESYVIFTTKPSSTYIGESFSQVKAYIVKGQTIYQIILDQYDSNGLSVFEQVIPTVSIN